MFAIKSSKLVDAYLGEKGLDFLRRSGIISGPLTSLQRVCSGYNGILQGYEIGKVIGSGAYSDVYEAKRIASGEKVDFNNAVAIKLPKPDVVLGYTFERFLSDILPMRHQLEGCVEILDIIFDSKLHIFGIVMELITDPTLEKLLENNSIYYLDAVRITINLCEIVEKMHNKNIIHRDIKPSNIFVARDGSVRLFDFEFAAILNNEGKYTDRRNSCTPAYVAPEQIALSPMYANFDKRINIYMIGTILYQMLSGLLPFEENCGVQDFMRNKLYNDPFDIRSFLFGGDVPDALLKVVMKSISRSAGNRQQSAKELAEDIRNAAGIE